MAKYVQFNTSGMKLPIGGETSGFFSKITSVTKNMSTTTIAIITSTVLFLLFGILYYIYYMAPTMKPIYKPNNEHLETKDEQKNTAELLFFFADWCPHCKAAKPIWNDVESEYQNKTINGYRIVFTKIDCSDESPEVEKMMNQFNIEGYPTIKLIKDGQVIEYDAKPSKETLHQFLNSVL
jgi:thiol-disulfide isomerase/thioredoxin